MYYEPQSGMYFYFDEQSREYKYHSSIDAAKRKMLTHIIYNRSAKASADKKGRANQRSKRLQKAVENPDTVSRFLINAQVNISVFVIGIHNLTEHN